MKRFVLLFLAVLLAGEYIKEFIHKKTCCLPVQTKLCSIVLTATGLVN